jgi:hypothetical protein
MTVRVTLWSGGCAAVFAMAVSYAAAMGKPPAPSSGPAVSAARAAVERYCLACHNDEDEKGGLSFEGMNVRTMPRTTHWSPIWRPPSIA